MDEYYYKEHIKTVLSMKKIKLKGNRSSTNLILPEIAWDHSNVNI